MQSDNVSFLILGREHEGKLSFTFEESGSGHHLKRVYDDKDLLIHALQSKGYQVTHGPISTHDLKEKASLFRFTDSRLIKIKSLNDGAFELNPGIYEVLAQAWHSVIEKDFLEL